MVNWGIVIYSLLDFSEQLNTNMIFNWLLSIHVNFCITRRKLMKYQNIVNIDTTLSNMRKMFHDTFLLFQTTAYRYLLFVVKTRDFILVLVHANACT